MNLTDKRIPLVLPLLLALVTVLVPRPAQAGSIQDLSSKTLAPGVILREVRYNTGSRNIIVDVLDMDLNNPGFDLEMVAGQGRFTQKATVSQMAASSGSVALVNGDFYNTRLQGAPFGPTVVEGRVTSTPLLSVGLNAFGIDSSRTAYIGPVTFKGSVTAADGASFPLAGLNKAAYTINHLGIPSHDNAIQAYDDFWASTSRGRSSSGEILLGADKRVEAISLNKPLPYPVPQGKMILQVHGQAKDFAASHIKVGDRVQVTYQLDPARSWSFMIGGHAKLVAGGQAQVYTLDANAIGGRRARSGVGIDRAGKRVFIASSEAKTSRSSGVRLNEWGNFFKDLGAHEALNLDGGGSTTMVARQPGSFEAKPLTRPEGGGSQRRVVNGIGVKNTSPRGSLAEMVVAGPQETLQGQVAPFSIERAWDTNIHPIKPETINFSIKDSLAGAGAFSGHRYLSPLPGETTVTLTSPEGVQASKNLRVLPPDQAQAFRIQADAQALLDTGTTEARLFATNPAGKEVPLDPSVATWTFEGMGGEVDSQSWKPRQEDGSLMDPLARLSRTELDDVPFGLVTATYGQHEGTIKINNPAYKLVNMKIGQTRYHVDGQPGDMDTIPFIENDRTLVPLRFLMEAYGADVAWDHQTYTALVSYKGMEIKVPIGQARATVNGQDFDLDVAAQLKNDRTMVPLRFLSETLGMIVDYNHPNRSVNIYEKR